MRNVWMTLTSFSLITLVGCGQIPHAVINPTPLSVKLPDESTIQSVDIASDGAGSGEFEPNNQVATVSQVLGWLQSSQPVSVHFPKVHAQTGASGGYTGPSVLLLTLKGGGTIEIFPAYYPVHSKRGYEDRYLDGIVEYESWDGPAYFQSPTLYTWLKNDQWDSQFHASGQIH